MLKIIVDGKRKEIIEIVDKDNSNYRGFYQVDVNVPFSIKVHTFESALKKYEKAEKSFDIYNLLIKELYEVKSLIEQVLIVKQENFQLLVEKYPSNNREVKGSVLEVANLVEESVKETLEEICLKACENNPKLNYKKILKSEIDRIRSSVVHFVWNLDPKTVENMKFKIGYDGSEGEWLITEKNDKRWLFKFKAIFAGGFNVQCLHTRTVGSLKEL